DAEKADEGAPHPVCGRESSIDGNLFESLLCSFQLAARRFNTGMQNVLRRCGAYLSREDAFEVANAHRHALRQNLHREFLLNVFGDPDLKFLNRPHLRCLGSEGNTQLLLSARAPKIQNEFPCGFMGERAAAILFDPGKGKVDSRGNTSRGVNVAVPDPQMI